MVENPIAKARCPVRMMLRSASDSAVHSLIDGARTKEERHEWPADRRPFGVKHRIHNSQQWRFWGAVGKTGLASRI